MLPPRTRLDPQGYYALLGLEPASSQEAITAAFRRKARELHPDVPGTGDAGAFLDIRQAYEVLSNRELRATYDRDAREPVASAPAPDASSEGASARHWAASAASGPGPGGQTSVDGGRWAAQAATFMLARWPRFSDVRILVWVGLGGLLCLCMVEAALHLRSPPAVVHAEIRPNAAAVAPLSPSAHRAALYGPAPVRLAGTPNFYILPAAGAAVLWRRDSERQAYVPIGQLPPFSAVQAVRLSRQTGLVEVLLSDNARGDNAQGDNNRGDNAQGDNTRGDKAHAYIDARRLTPGSADAARRAYCGYNAGPTPVSGELLDRRRSGDGSLALENRSVQPAVVKLRDASGALVLSVFLGPNGHAELARVPDGTFRLEFAIGELWSRACNTFAAGMRASRLAEDVTVTSETKLVVPPEGEKAAPDEVSDQAFNQD